MTGDDFRELALALHGAVEGSHMGHPDFRTNRRIFASLDAAERKGTVKLTAEEQRALMRSQPRMFAPAAGAWGRQGWTIVHLDVADETAVRGALLLAWGQVTAKPVRRAASSRTSASRSPRSRKG